MKTTPAGKVEKNMNTETMELNLNEMETVSGGSFWDHLNGVTVGAEKIVDMLP